MAMQQDILGNSESFKSKMKITGKNSPVGNTEDIKIAVPLKHLNSFWRTLQMLLINCEINLILTWFEDCIIPSATGRVNFVITDTKHWNKKTGKNISLK